MKVYDMYIAGSGVSKDKLPLRKQVYAYLIVVLLVLKPSKILFLVVLEVLLSLTALELKRVTLEITIWVCVLICLVLHI